MKKLVIYGTGGFGREAATYERPDYFCVSDEYYKDKEVNGIPVLRESELDKDKHRMVIAVGNPQLRSQIYQRLDHILMYNLVADGFHENQRSGFAGLIICPYVAVTTNVWLRKQTHLNLHTSIGHDCRIGDFFTTAPGARISGNCTIGDRVYIGTNAAVKEGITICDDVTIGMGAMVVKDITEPGTYVGVPARKIHKPKDGGSTLKDLAK